MKSERVLLAQWLGDCTDGYVDIPWPLIHQQIGKEVVSWLNDKDWDQVQMILEKNKADAANQQLWAEFYQRSLRSEFALRFGL
jgi:hypothetical protein